MSNAKENHTRRGGGKIIEKDYHFKEQSIFRQYVFFGLTPCAFQRRHWSRSYGAGFSRSCFLPLSWRPASSWNLCLHIMAARVGSRHVATGKEGGYPHFLGIWNLHTSWGYGNLHTSWEYGNLHNSWWYGTSISLMEVGPSYLLEIWDLHTSCGYGTFITLVDMLTSILLEDMEPSLLLGDIGTKW